MKKVRALVGTEVANLGDAVVSLVKIQYSLPRPREWLLPGLILERG